MLRMRLLRWMPRLVLGLGLLGIAAAVVHGHASPAPVWMHE